MKYLYLLLILLLAGCVSGPMKFEISPPITVADSKIYVVYAGTSKTIGVNISQLSTIISDKNGVRELHSTGAASPGLFKAILPSGGVSGAPTRYIVTPIQ
jgi:hypothetical protein